LCAATVQQPEQISCNVGKSDNARIRAFTGFLQAPETSGNPSYCLHTAGVAGSNPASPTPETPANGEETEAPD
jgi:hypothetical protein